MISVRGIHKHFPGGREVLRGLDFDVQDGEVVALMGANGAGKSTLFGILSTLDRDFEGEAFIGGVSVREDPLEIRRHLGYVPGRFSLYEDLSVQENMDFFAQAYGVGAHDIPSQLWESLIPFRNARAGTLSGGMKQKLAFCCARVHHPDVLLLDEPTVGVDPVSRYELWNEILSLRQEKACVLVSTHYLDEAERADRILFLHQGRQLLYDTPEHILAQYGQPSLEEVFIQTLKETP